MTGRFLGGWDIFELDVVYLPTNTTYHQEHCIPTDDLYPHETTPGCWCDPYEFDADKWMHNSADGREAYEQNVRKLN